MDNSKIKTGTLMRVHMQSGTELKLSGVIEIVPEQDVTMLVKVPFFLKGSPHVADLVRTVTNSGGRVEVLKD